MTNLDDIREIKKLDTVDVLSSLEQLGLQCKQAWEEVQKINFPEEYKNVSKIVFSGMGGSALGAYVVKSLYFDKLHLPFEIVNDYHLPPYVNEQTLVILGTYSGSTEETLSCAKEALARKAKITGITTGKDLAQYFTENNLPGYIFEPRYNPSGQPRVGTGYSVFAQIAILNKLGIISIEDGIADKVVSALEKGNKQYSTQNPESQNRAKQLARKWIGKIPIIVAAEFLTNVGRVVRNQIHETAKSFSAFHDLPELNHHLMEGLKNPKQNKDLLEFLFLTSPDYSPRIKKRFEVTKDVVAKNKIAVNEFTAQTDDRITQVFECIQFGAYVNYYMAVLYNVDPSQIPWVDYFKAQLAS